MNLRLCAFEADRRRQGEAQAKGKVKVKAKITFTPSGGTPSVQVRKLTVRAPKAAK